MKAFVAGRRSDSPARQQPHSRPSSVNSIRQAVGESARVKVPATSLSHPVSTPAVRNITLRSEKRKPQHVQEPADDGHDRNAFDTDLDETTTIFSDAGFEQALSNNQYALSYDQYERTQRHGEDAIEMKENNDDGDGYDSEMTDDADLRGSYSDDTQLTQEQTNAMIMQLSNQILGHPPTGDSDGQLGIFDADESYPTTTSGHPDESEMQNEQSMENVRFELQKNPVDNNPNFLASFQMPSQMQSKGGVSTFQQPQAPPTQPVHLVEARFKRQRHVKPALATHFRNNSQKAQAARLDTMPIIHAKPPPNYPRDTTNAMNLPLTTRNHATPHQNQVTHSATPQQKAVGIYEARNVSQPVEESVESLLDYKEQDLFQKEYSDLETESFDLDPGAKPLDNPDLESSKPLESRMTYAMHHLSSDDQAKLFASLPLDEWEEAGDWFLGQFGVFIKRIADSRRQKRKVANGFELEVGKRNEAVSCKRRKVDEAFSSMKMGGEELLRTPKKTPQKRLQH